MKSYKELKEAVGGFGSFYSKSEKHAEIGRDHDDEHKSSRPAQQKIYHKVAFKDKESAKAEGMRYDGDKKKWYHTSAQKSNASKFVKEEVEELDELSKNTLHTYSAKATTSAKELTNRSDYAQLSGDEEKAKDLFAKSQDRKDKVKLAQKKIDSFGSVIKAKGLPHKAKGPLLYKHIGEEVEELDEIKLATVGKIIKHSPKIVSAAVGAAVAAHSAEPPKQPAKPSSVQVVKKVQKEGVDEAYAPPGVKVAGEFQEKEHGKFFHYSKAEPNSWGAKHGLPHVIHVGGIHNETRFGHVKGTVAHIATDEDEHGKPVIDKWSIKKHHKYTNEDVADYTGTQIDEVLTPDTSAGEVVKDFQKSDAPQFKGKSKEKRHQMAIAAYLDLQRKKNK